MTQFLDFYTSGLGFTKAKMSKILLVVQLLTVLYFASSERVAGSFYDEVERGNKYIDDLLRDMVHEHGYEYDPYILEDGVIGFSKKIMFVNVSGEAKLHNGYITGLKSLHRPDYCKVNDNDEDGRLSVTAELGAGVLTCHYDGTVKFMNFGPTISIYGEIKYVEIHMEFSVDSQTGENGRLEKFYIDDIKGMKVEITGLGPLNWAVNYMISGVTSLFSGVVKRVLESQIRNHIADRLPDYNFPVSDVTQTETPQTTEPPTDVDAFAEELYNKILSDLKYL